MAGDYFEGASTLQRRRRRGYTGGEAKRAIIHDGRLPKSSMGRWDRKPVVFHSKADSTDLHGPLNEAMNVFCCLLAFHYTRRALGDASDPHKTAWRTWVKSVDKGQDIAEEVRHIETSKEVLATHKALLFVLDATIGRDDWPTDDRGYQVKVASPKCVDPPIQWPTSTTISDAPSPTASSSAVATLLAIDPSQVISDTGDDRREREEREDNRRRLKRSRDVEESEGAKESAATEKPAAKRPRRAKASPPAPAPARPSRRLRSQPSRYNLRSKARPGRQRP